MVELELFDARDAPTVAGWAGDEAASMLWCSLPSVSADVVAGWSEGPSVEAFVLCDGDSVTGYGEIWVDVGENEVELAHLIVGPDARRRGLGRKLVDGLVEQAQRHYPMIALRVHSRNAVAIRCYRSAGFERVSAAEEAEWNRGQPVEYVWMVRRRQ